MTQSSSKEFVYVSNRLKILYALICGLVCEYNFIAELIGFNKITETYYFI